MPIVETRSRAAVPRIEPMVKKVGLLELRALAAGVILIGLTALDGEFNLLEDVMLCGVYFIAVLTFFSR